LVKKKYEWPMPMEAVREELGQLWGLDRSLTRIELARALNLSAKNGGDYISRMERNSETPSGAMEVAVRMMLDGGVPFTMENVVKPGYPRGAVRK
jgi:hypothetical protein